MKIKRLVFRATVSSFLIIHSAFGQGALTPPGPPGPTMLTLSQIEPRTPISGPGGIFQPGSYYLTTNIAINSSTAILIEASNVKLDLNGFTISSTSPSAQGYAIYIGPFSPQTNVTIVNGFISSGVTNNSNGVYGGSGFNYGIFGNGINLQVKNVSVSGCMDDGINLGLSSSVVEGCSVNTAGNYGIEAQSVSDSTAMNCGYTGIGAQTVNNCYGQGYYLGIKGATDINCYGYSTTTISGTGLDAITADNCYGYSNGDGAGISTDNANNCYGYNTGTGYGLYAYNIVIGCYGYSYTGTGINAGIANSCESSSGDGGISYKYNMP